MTGPVLTVICVLRSGGIYTPDWVLRLARGVDRNLHRPHSFVCLTDTPEAFRWVKIETDTLLHNWPGWWSKIELFRPGAVNGPTLYLDLDTVIAGPLDPIIDALIEAKPGMALLRSFARPEWGVGSGVMWFDRYAPFEVYRKFSIQPEYWMKLYEGVGVSCGDQAFIAATCERSPIPLIQDLIPERSAMVYGLPAESPPEALAPLTIFKGQFKQDAAAHFDTRIAEAWA